ncbi:MAG: sugar-transfer associated ATP-grasp domain-containing protein [Chromatiales bacterium]|jgi:hypothetical protein
MLERRTLPRSLLAKVERRGIYKTIGSFVFPLRSIVECFFIRSDFFSAIKKTNGKSYTQQVLERLKIVILLRMEPTAYYSQGFCFRTSLRVKELNEFLSRRQVVNLNTYLSENVPLPKNIEIVSDKAKFADFCNTNGIATPKIYLTYKPDELFFDENLKKINLLLDEKESIFLKPIDGYLGKGQAIILRAGNDRWDIKDNKSNHKSLARQEVLNYLENTPLIWGDRIVLQEVIKNHSALLRFGSDALFTVRLWTVKLKDDFLPVTATFKINESGKISDNHGQNRTVIDIDLNSGKLGKGSQVYCGKNPILPLSVDSDVNGNVFTGMQFPFFQEMIETGLNFHRNLNDFVVLGHDIAVTENGPVMIETNMILDCTVFQTSSGKGILSTSYLESVLDSSH